MHGDIYTKENGVLFQCPNPIFCRMKNYITFSELKEKAEMKVKEVYFHREVSLALYCKPSNGDDGCNHYSEMSIRRDDDICAMMETHAQFSRVSPMELNVNILWGTNEIFFLLSK